MTDAERFEASLAGEPPPGLSRPLLALWHLGRGEWELAHGLAQEDEREPAHCLVHAHLHRVEGDPGNAAYWYRRAGRQPATGDLKAEWRVLARELLAG